MKIAILSRNAKLYSTRRLIEAAEARGHTVKVVDVLRCYMNIASHKPMMGASAQRYQKYHRNLRIALKHKANPQITIPRKFPHFRQLISGEESQSNL